MELAVNGTVGISGGEKKGGGYPTASGGKNRCWSLRSGEGVHSDDHGRERGSATNRQEERCRKKSVSETLIGKKVQRKNDTKKKRERGGPGKQQRRQQEGEILLQKGV